MCLSPPTPERTKELQKWFDSSIGEKLGWLMDELQHYREHASAILGTDRRSGYNTLRERCEDFCEMQRTTAGDNSPTCWKCGNYRPNFEQWLLDRRLFSCWWASVGPRTADTDSIFAPSYIRQNVHEKA